MSPSARTSELLGILVLILIASMSVSIVVLLPLAAVCCVAAFDIARRGPRRDGLANVTLAFVALLLLNMVILIPPERLLSFDCWRWHGRVILAPLAMIALLFSPSSVPSGTLRRGLRIMLSVTAVVGLWGQMALTWHSFPTGFAAGRWNPSIVTQLADRTWFHGLFRHHEVAGGAFALASLYALSAAIDRGRGRLRLGWTLLFLGNVLGLVATVARAYLGGFVVGAAVIAIGSHRLAARECRRTVWTRVALAALFCAATLGTTPGVSRRLAVLFHNPHATYTDAHGEIRTSSESRSGGGYASMRSWLARLEDVELFSAEAGHVGQGPADSTYMRPISELIESMPVEKRTLWDRLILWRAAWEGFLMRPVFGSGVSSFPIHFRGHEFLWSQYNPEHHAHNDVLQLLVDGGVVGLVVAVGWVSLIVVRVGRRARIADEHGNLALGCLAGIACLAAAGLLDSNFYSPTLMLPIVVPAALLIRPPGSGDDAPPER